MKNLIDTLIFIFYFVATMLVFYHFGHYGYFATLVSLFIAFILSLATIITKK